MNMNRVLKASKGVVTLITTIGIASAAEITKTTDLIGDPIAFYNQLPASTQTGIVFITGGAFLFAIIAAIVGVLLLIAKASGGAVLHNAKMRSEALLGIFYIFVAGFVGFLIMGVIFWRFTIANI